MDTKIFLDNFGHIADAPNGVQKLRDLILQLAVQGKLVEQNLGEGSASDLVEEARKVKEKLLKVRKSREPKPLPKIEDAELPYDLPNNWCWVRLGDIQIFVNGFAFKSSEYDDKGVGLIRIGDIQNGVIDKGSMKYVPVKYLKELDKSLQVVSGDLVIAMSGATTGKLGFNRTDDIFLLNQRVGKIELILVDPIYAYYYLSTKVQENLSISAGSAIPNLSTVQINNIIYPLPPIEEQKRIVAKVDQLMALCDQLETQQKQKAQTRVALNNAVLDKLLTAQNPDEFNHHWQRIANNFHHLYDNLENLTKLRSGILELAIQGKLCVQNDGDEPASKLLSFIKEKEQQLAEEGEIKSISKLSEIKPEEYPHDLPQGWEWVRLGSITSKIGSGSTPRGGKNVYMDSGAIFLRSQNVWNDGLKLDDVAFITEGTHQKMSNTHVHSTDILLNITGASLGRCALVPENIGDANVSQHVTIIRPILAETRAYLHKLILSPYVQKMVWERQVGMAREGLSKKVLELFEIPLPPLEEQKRIVAKVDQLMALCDQLETKLKQAQTTSKKLADSVVYNMVVA